MICALPQHSQYLELFLAFNPFQIEEPSDLLFFFFFFHAAEHPSASSDCGWVVVRKWAGPFEKCPFLSLSLRFHTQVWASGLVLPLVCVFLNSNSCRKVAEVGLADPGERKGSWTPQAEEITWPTAVAGWGAIVLGAKAEGPHTLMWFELPTALGECPPKKSQNSEVSLE